MREEGFVAFVLGPVYVYAGVQVDLMSAFDDEVADIPVRKAAVSEGKLDIDIIKLSPSGGHMCFQHPVVSHCHPWSHILNVIDAVSFPHFKKWLLAQNFVNREMGAFVVVRHYVVPILDPIILDVSGRPVPELVDVFSVAGMRGTMCPEMVQDKAQAKSFIHFEHKPPDEHIIKMGAEALKLVKDA
jgi:hypothetical protein